MFDGNEFGGTLYPVEQGRPPAGSGATLSSGKDAGAGHQCLHTRVHDRRTDMCVPGEARAGLAVSAQSKGNPHDEAGSGSPRGRRPTVEHQVKRGWRHPRCGVVRTKIRIILCRSRALHVSSQGIWFVLKKEDF